MQRVRQLAGDETPAGVSQARAARTAAVNSSADGNADRTPQLFKGHKVASVVIDINSQKMPQLDTASPAPDTGYDFDKYLEGDMDPFNRASRVNVRRDDSRPLPGPRDEGDESGDTTARGAAPIAAESTPRVQSIKAAAAATPVMSPHASPSLSSRKLGHLKTLPGSSAQVNVPILDAAADMSKSRFDPDARSDRLQTLELAELRKKHQVTLRELSAAQEALSSAREESEGWASECSGLQTQLSTLQTAAARDQRTSVDLQLRLSQYKSEADDRTWKLHCQSQQTTQMQTELEYAKNEASFAESNLSELQYDWERNRDDLRIRLMLECKRADLLILHYKTAVQAVVRTKKRLAQKTRIVEDLEQENERLSAELALMPSSKTEGENAKQMRQLERQVAQLNTELESMREKDDMMAETRKNWKVERKALLAEVALLRSQSTSKSVSAPAPQVSAPVQKVQPSFEASSPVFGDKAKKHNRKPMQGASEMEPPSDYAEPAPAKAIRPADKPKSKPVSAPAPQPPPKAKPVSKNWRDEVAITDSDSGFSEEDERRKHKRNSGKSIISKKSSTTTTKSKSKPKATVGIEYDDQTADPSATPMIRNTGPGKRALGKNRDDDDDGEEQDQSVLATKFGRDRTNFIGATHKPKIAAQPAVDEALPRKKKRKLLGGGSGGPSSGWGAETEGLGPNFDIPLELSPIKAAPSGAGGGRGLLGGFPGFGTAGPFA